MDCEAMVGIKRPYNKQVVYARCGKADADLHHKLTRARGGLILDNIGETYHHMRLCREHHAYAHDSGNAIKNGLLLEGYVTSDASGVHYDGPDEYLKETYP